MCLCTLVLVYLGTCVPWMAIEIKFSKLCIFCSLEKHLYVSFVARVYDE